MASDTEQQRATFSIDIDRSPDDVWWALVDSGRWSKWMGPGSTIQPWIGGKIKANDLVTGIPKEGRVDHVVPRTILEFTWWPAEDESGGEAGEPDEPTVVTFELHRMAKGTRLTVVETAPTGGGNLAAMAAAGAWRATMLSLLVQTKRKVRMS